MHLRRRKGAGVVGACVEFIQNPWGDSLSLLHRACLCDHRCSFLLVYLEEPILQARASAFFVALGSSLSL